MSDPNTVFIISPVGGGQRGHLTNEWLDLFFARAFINPNRVWEIAKILAGASIGGINAAALGYGYSPADLRPFFIDYGKWLFTIRSVPIGCNADTPSNRPNLAQKAGMFLIDDPFYKSACAPNAGNSNYGDNILQNALIEKFADNTMQSLKTNVLIPSLRNNTNQFVVFSNYNNPFYEGQNELIRNVLRATSAAPIYLPQYSFGGNIYDDGGIFMNNVALEAYMFAKIRYPTAKRFCILSAGTGKGQYSYDGGETPTTDIETLFTKAANLLGQTMDGQSASVDRALRIMSSSYTLDEVYYYSFNPALDPALDNSLDNTAESYMTYLTNLATTTFNNDLANIDAFIERLNT